MIDLKKAILKGIPAEIPQKKDIDPTIVSNDGMHVRIEYTEKGYSEVEINPIIKSDCYFQDWNKNILTPVSGLFEYYDENGDWVASIDFGDGKCDEWATKRWDVNVFPNFPKGSSNFSVFDLKSKK